MSLDLAAVGYEAPPFFFEYDWKTVVLYNLGVGSRRSELDYLYEKRGPLVVPSFAVVPTYPALEPLVEKAGADMAKVVHGAQTIRLLAPIPASGRLTTTARIEGIYDLRRFSQVVFSTTTKSEDGTALFETTWMLVVRETGGFGGPRPPKIHPPKPLPNREPVFSIEAETSEEQALLYRLSGDLNPLHADPTFAQEVGFERGPILHGLCTFGFVARAIVQGACQGAPERLKELSVQFKKPVWPGETIKTVGQLAEDGRLCISASATEDDNVVVGGAYAVVSPS
jgi:acyl dehydratase